MSAPKYLTIHCAATPDGRDIKASRVNEWALDRFGQPSYHHIIERNGTVKRFLNDNQKGAHVGGHNTDNIGICYVGGMDAKMQHAKDTRTVEQKETLKALIKHYKELYPTIIIRGHRDWPGVRKDCPSFDVKSWINLGMP